MNFDSRIEDIPSYVSSYFLNSINGRPEFYILDPYLEPLQSIYGPTIDRHKSKDDKLYLKIMLDVLEVNKQCNFKIITDCSLDLLQDSMRKTDTVTPSIPKFLVYGENGIVEVAKYPSKTGKFPNKLHDRWFLLKNDNIFKGVHFGPSLDDFSEKDCTVTFFDDQSAKEAAERFEHLWSLLQLRAY